MVTIDKIFQASVVLKDIIRPTPLAKAYGIAPECSLYLKPENLQNTGSFKLRGSGYKIAMLSEEEKRSGVIACSAGNHAQGVALAASKCGIESLICLPDTAPISKVEATKGFGAQVCLVPGVYDDAYSKALELKEEKGYTFVHPFDDEYVIAGQGTIGLEIMNEMSDVDAVIVPIGGGGLISGVACAIKSISPHVKVYGVQAAGAPSMHNAIRSGHPDALPSVSTIADGIAVKKPGDLTFKMVNCFSIRARMAAAISSSVTRVISVHHERNGDTESINGCYLRLTLETRNYDHVQEITQALKNEGFKIV